MQELRSKEFSSPGVQEFRSLTGARSAAGGQEFLSPAVYGRQEFLRTAVREAKSSWGQLFRKPGVPEANRSGGQEFLRPDVQVDGLSRS